MGGSVSRGVRNGGKDGKVAGPLGTAVLEVGVGNPNWDSGWKGLEPGDRAVAAGPGSVGVILLVGFSSAESLVQEVRRWVGAGYPGMHGQELLLPRYANTGTYSIMWASGRAWVGPLYSLSGLPLGKDTVATEPRESKQFGEGQSDAGGLCDG